MIVCARKATTLNSKVSSEATVSSGGSQPVVCTMITMITMMMIQIKVVKMFPEFELSRKVKIPHCTASLFSRAHLGGSAV